MSVAAVIGFGVVYTCAAILGASKIADWLGVMDQPGAQNHKKHLKPTPQVGGLAALPPALTVLFYVSNENHASHSETSAVVALLLCGTAAMFLGLFDDRRHIPALTRLFICALIFLLAIAIAPELSVTVLDIQGLGLTLTLGALAVPFTILCLLAFLNAVNMADGRNGLVPGLVLIWLVALLSYNPSILTFPLLTLTLSMLLVTAANIGGRLFLGDAGAYGVGAIIGLSTIWVHQQNIGLHTIDIAIMFFFPICDMLRLIVLRILEGRHPFSADHHHLHHYLDQSIGWRRGRNLYLFAAGLPILSNRLGVLDGPLNLGVAAMMYVWLILTHNRVARIRSKSLEPADQ